MIAHLAGVVTEKLASSIIIDVHDIGYELIIPTSEIENLNLQDKVKYYTYHAVRENSEELYGFSSLSGKRLFEMLISVNGVGPKAAIAILSLAPSETVRNAIANADSSFIAKAAGIGKKSAERIIVDLRDRVGAPSTYGSADLSTPFSTTTSTPPKDEALDALIALGFQLKEASIALAEVDPNLPVEERIKLALKK